MELFDAPTRFRKPLWFEVDVPREKAAVVSKLNKMKSDGWRALESMSLEELDALQAEAMKAVVNVDDFGYVKSDNDHDRAIYDACRAIKDQRYKLKQAKEDRYFIQSKRSGAIVEAAEHIRLAAYFIEEAYSIERDPDFYLSRVPAQLPAIDAATMTDYELQATIRAYEDELQSTPAPDHKLFAMMNTPAAKAIAAELKEQNEARAARLDMAMANSKAAREELNRREVDTAKAAARKEILQANLDEVLTELQGRITELEASK